MASIENTIRRWMSNPGFRFFGWVARGVHKWALLPRRLALAAACLVFFSPGTLLAEVEGGARVAILVSKNIQPYMLAADGAAAALKAAGHSVSDVVLFQQLSAAQRAGQRTRVTTKTHDLVIAIGPEAARFAWSPQGFDGLPRVYAMVRNPDKVIESGAAACGIPLNIPVAEQLGAIRRGQPGIRRLGLLFDPSQNPGLGNLASLEAARLGMTVRPLAITSRREIPTILATGWDLIDALWVVPDRTTVVSRRLVEYVIRQSIYQKVPVIGYDRYFYDNGASMVFVFDYRQIGAQCAQEGLRILAGESCRPVSPAFRLWVNTRVAGRLGAPVPEQMLYPLWKGP